MVDTPKHIVLRPRRERASRRFTFAIAAVAALMLAGCSESTRWTPAESPKKSQVDWIHFDHRVIFEPRGHDISARERARLHEFLSRIEPRYGDQILVGTGTERAEGEMGIERVAAVAEYLRGFGLKVGPLPGIPQARWDGAIRISVGRYVVTPPNCPDWSKSASYDPLNQVSSNFGCATTTNLDLMVADPGDLVRGRPMGPTDGDYAARKIKAWREGEKSSSSSSTSMTLSIGGSDGGGAGTGAPQ